MTQFSDKLDLKERAEEDIFFARRDRELIAALHAKASGDLPVRGQENRTVNPECAENGHNQDNLNTTHYHEVIRKILSVIHPPGRA